MSFSATPKRARPTAGEAGSTPFRSQSSNRFRSSLVPMSRQVSSPGPSRTTAQPTTSKLTGFSTNQRDLFRTTSTPKAQPFAPQISTAAASKTESVRKFAPQRSVLNGMNTTGAKDLFQMRIPSPDPELSGEALAKQVPDDPSRSGSVYADQYLADKCPPHFDDLQRRQFFCILDLRRLKYAADEIFVKKDWKLNILNFAKEYEKSRSIILLRYGLYEFKNVKPNPETMRKWRLANGLPELPEEEMANADQRTTTSRVGGASSKRKAEDDLASKGNAFGTTASNQNKRRNVNPEDAPNSKRRTIEDDEQRATPSAATSAFQKILDKTQSPAKRSAAPESSTSTLFVNQGAQKDKQTSSFKSNPFGSASSTANTFAASASSIFSNPAKGASEGSILSTHKVGTVPANTSGIFSYLSESSNNSGNEVDDDEPDEEEDEEDEESEQGSQNEPDSQDAAPSYDESAAASTGTSTPPIQNGSALFPSSNTSAASNIFGAAAQSNGLGAKGGLFGRVKMGTDGQPLRATPGLEDKENSVSESKEDTPAKPAGGNFTFDATKSPISFGAPANKSAAPALQPTSSEPPNFVSTPSGNPSSIFGTQNASKPAATPLFGAPSNAPETSTSKPAAGTPSIFGAPKAVAPTPASSIFANPAQPKETAPAKTQSTPASIFAGFGANGTTSSPAAPLFGSASPSKKRGADADDEPSAKRQAPGAASQPSTTSLFGNAAPSFGAKKPEGQAAPPASSIFGAAAKPATSGSIFAASKDQGNGQEKQQPPLFGAAPPAKQDTVKSPPTAASQPFGSFGSDAKTADKPFQFANAQAAPTPAKPADTPAKSIFANAAPSSSSAFSFGGQTPVKATENKPAATPSFTFGAKPAEPAAPPASASFSFGGSTNASPSVSFGATPSGAGSQSFDFNFGGGSAPGGASSTFNFGAGGGNGSGSANSSFTFSAGGGNNAVVSNPFAQANGASSNGPIFGAGGGVSAPAAASTPKPASSFGFQFGGQTPAGSSQTNLAGSSSIFGSQPNGSMTTTNGGPSFSFSQATPGKDSAAPKSLGIFGNLAPSGGDGSTRGGSPMPAPSSMGTTPVNGTPEPQSQNDDGDDDAPQAQLSLTEGGPGEEDEDILHEIRAKAIKFIPIDKDADEDEKKKSPWSTQGVGPLRVLKSKSTGTVRILLRAEPRGHIALNKAILADIEYKAKDKTLNFATSNDDGSGLETWVLQVKKPEFATELAGILEANKSANKR